MNHESKRQIQIEDLLRLKRAERPAGEFWNEFDRQLRAKQLAAIVEKRPWWQRLPKVWRGLPRYTVPLGAATVFMVTYISVRDDRPASVRQNAFPATVQAGSTRQMTLAEPTPAAADEKPAMPTPRLSDDASASLANAAQTSASANTLASDATAPGELSTLIPLIGPIGAEPAKATSAGAAQLVADSLVPATATTTALPVSFLKSGATLEQRASVRQAVEPLQQITPPSERLRARLLTAMVSMQSNDAPGRVTGSRAATQISEENLYDTTHRFGARGAGVMMKF